MAQQQWGHRLGAALLVLCVSTATARWTAGRGVTGATLPGTMTGTNAVHYPPHLVGQSVPGGGMTLASTVSAVCESTPSVARVRPGPLQASRCNGDAIPLTDAAAPWEVPPGLAAAVRRTLAAARYAFRAQGSHYTAANPAQAWRVSVAASSLRVQPQGSAPTWTWTLTLHGYGAAAVPLLPPVATARAGRRGAEVVYERGLLNEWYITTAQGVEQGFTLERAPAHVGNDGAVALGLSIGGTLAPRSVAGGRALDFVAADGRPRVHYGGLAVRDARGKTLRARLVVAEGGRSVRLVVQARGATYPLRVDPWVQQAELAAFSSTAFDDVGTSVSLSGNTALVGAALENSGTGAAYVFVRSGRTWSPQAMLIASDGAANDAFGWSVALSGDTALVGAYNHDRTGAVYVFVRSGTTWSPQAELTAGTPAAEFGYSVALSGNTALVGAPPEAPSGRGSAYIFVQSGGAWARQTEIKGPVGGFGSCVALSGGTALVGAPGNAVYVFVQSSNIWSLQARLIAWDGAASDSFGWSVALSGGTALVGAPQEAPGGTGAAYIFTRSGSTWSPQARLTASDGAPYDNFGISVALSGDAALVGAPGKNVGTGVAYVFVRSGRSWSQQAELTAGDGATNDAFGQSVALSGGTALVGAPYKNIYSGAAYVFVFVPPPQTNMPAQSQASLKQPDGHTGSGHPASSNWWRPPERRQHYHCLRRH